MRPAVCACLCALTLQTVPLQAAESPPPEPIVLLDGRNIVACGVRIAAETGGAENRLDVMLMRTKDAADLVARLMPGGSRSIERFGLTTATQSSDQIFSESPLRDDGVIELRAPAASAAVTSLIQELMVSGAVLDVTYAGNEKTTSSIRGPMPQSVRAAYLNCAGDLYRPGD